jgi:thioesterase DpgC
MERAMSSANVKTVSENSGNSRPQVSGDYASDCANFSKYWADGFAIIDAMPARRDRTAEQQAKVEAILKAARAARETFLDAHVDTLYRALTDNLRVFKRVETLAVDVVAKVPGLCPDPARIARENPLIQSEKDGHELDQGLFFNRILANRDCGLHLVHAMLLPRKEALAKLDTLKREGKVMLGHASVHRQGKASIVEMKNGRYLNAEDDTTVADVETAVDLAMLDPETSICVLRGGVIESGKYAGQRTFCTGINLTHIYYGRISYLWYLIRDLGFIHKMYRGMAYEHISPNEMTGDTLEKPWITAIDKFAIGGGCQYLLAADYNIAASDAYMTLPARKEGIVPGIANLRMPRFVGDRVTRQAIMADRRLDCDSDVGRMICDLVVPPEEMDKAINDTIERLTTSGVVSAASNRRAIRIAFEPLDLFRTYIAVYAREQAYCHYSPALISNLERFWNAQNRKM